MGLIDISLNISNEELNEQIQEIESIVENDIQIQYKSYENRLKQEFMKWSVVFVFKTITDYNGINQLESTGITEVLNASKVFIKYLKVFICTRPLEIY